MQTQVFCINEKKFLESSSFDRFLECRIDGDSHFWIDISQLDSAAFETAFAPLSFHLLVVEGCLDPTANAVVMPFPESLFVKFPIQTTWQTSERAALAVVCLPQAMITAHAQPAPFLDIVRTDFAASRHFHAKSIPAILYQVLDMIFDEALSNAIALRQCLDMLSDAIDSESDAVPIGQILTRKRQVAYFMITLEEQHRCVSALQTIESDFFDLTELHEYFRDAIAHLEYALRLVAHQESRLAEMHQHYLLMLQDKTNNRLKVLTILSAVFMPLTLLASIYGMNFHHMPELNWTYSYPLLLVGMMVIASIMMWFFYSRGWFK